MAGGAGPDRAALNSRGVLTLPFQPAELPEGSATGRGADHPDPVPVTFLATHPAVTPGAAVSSPPGGRWASRRGCWPWPCTPAVPAEPAATGLGSRVCI